MATFVVRLETHQYADVTVTAPEGSDTGTLTQLALRALDDSGGDEWRTEYTETIVTGPLPEQAPAP